MEYQRLVLDVGQSIMAQGEGREGRATRQKGQQHFFKDLRTGEGGLSKFIEEIKTTQ